MLIANRDKIVWCTKLARAKSEDERSALEREMYNDAALTDILGQLKATRASARDRKNAIIEEVKEEARRLRTHDKAEGAEVVDRDVADRQVRPSETLCVEHVVRPLAQLWPNGAALTDVWGSWRRFRRRRNHMHAITAGVKEDALRLHTHGLFWPFCPF